MRKMKQAGPTWRRRHQAEGHVNNRTLVLAQALVSWSTSDPKTFSSLALDHRRSRPPFHSRLPMTTKAHSYQAREPTMIQDRVQGLFLVSIVDKT